MKATALLLIDVQQAFEDPAWGPRNNPQAEGNLRRLLAAFRTAGLPVIHVKHDSTEPDSTLRPECPGNALMRGMEPVGDEPLFGKTVNSAFIGTGLEAHLRSRGIEGLVIGGFITNHCVSTTARMAGNLGFRTVVVADACATFDFRDADGVIPAETMHRIGLAELRSEFAEILNADDVLARLAPA
jgi:nicotinamidase-related amidase